MKNITKYGGLRLRPNFHELITYLETGQPRKSLPTRAATTFRNLHQFTQLDGDTLTDLAGVEARHIQNYMVKRASISGGCINSRSSNTN